jgi:hypothetical protein
VTTYGIYRQGSLVDTRENERSALAVAASLSLSKFHGQIVSVQITINLHPKVIATFRDGHFDAPP